MEKDNKDFTEIARVDLDFDAISQWRKTEADDLPPCSMMSFYEACGVMQLIRDYVAENKGKQVTGLDNLRCNFYTMQRIKNFITDIWRRYSLTILEDNKVAWDTHKYAKGIAHRPKELKARVRNSVNYDFMNYCPKVDDDLPDNVIVFATLNLPPEDEIEEAEVVGVTDLDLTNEE